MALKVVQKTRFEHVEVGRSFFSDAAGKKMWVKIYPIPNAPLAGHTQWCNECNSDYKFNAALALEGGDDFSPTRMKHFCPHTAVYYETGPVSMQIDVVGAVEKVGRALEHAEEVREMLQEMNDEIMRELEARGIVINGG